MPDIDDADQENFDNISSLYTRFNKMLKTTMSCGEYDRLTLGWFENYPSIKFKHTHLEPVCILFLHFYLV